MWSDFKTFLIKQNALALAIAVVIGAALDRVVKAIVDGFIMPIVAVALPAGTWQTATWDVGPFVFQLGLLFAALVNFVIVGLVAWRISKAFIRPDAPRKDDPVRNCPYCRMSVDTAATRCAYCTSELVAA